MVVASGRERDSRLRQTGRSLVGGPSRYRHPSSPRRRGPSAGCRAGDLRRSGRWSWGNRVTNTRRRRRHPGTRRASGSSRGRCQPGRRRGLPSGRAPWRQRTAPGIAGSGRIRRPECLPTASTANRHLRLVAQFLCPGMSRRVRLLQAFARDMRVNLGRTNTGVPENFLHTAQIRAAV